ncbi:MULTISPECIES: amidase [Paenarthrobacter]|uniref:Amidase n=1 Tax=Paenarthrobacter aurescens (strain TC1) TaxID=290340 RepID=A1RD12_PAEAT|nr:MULTISPECIES: amidase [Paenarthrobacter]ABM10419.1 putative Amidase [Paenarthrobacter aurescens TC1]MCY0975531.1 amidase [Paenarthrobacter ureafaciens]
MKKAASLRDAGPFQSVSVTDLADNLRQGKVTSGELTERALNAAREFGPRINCFVTLDEKGARRAAEQADAELSSGCDRGPLHGVPVGVKDIISTAGLMTGMGSKHFAGHVPNTDAAVVTSLRSAGAVIIGKTHAHEFAYGPTGDIAVTGPALNPNDISRVTGGSSSGSAAAVAAGLLPIAIGTDTAGSVRIPASLCGVVGMRPTSGTVSPAGVFPLSRTLDVIGPMAGSVTDTALLWRAMVSRPDHTGVTGPWLPLRVPNSPTQSPLLRVGEVKCALTERVSYHQIEALQIAVSALVDSGAVTVEVPIPEVDECGRVHQAIQSAEAYALHQDRVESAPDLFDPEILRQLRAASEVSGWEYVLAMQTRDRLREQVLAKLSSIDLLVMPTVPIEAPLIGQRELQGENGWTSTREALKSMTVPWSLLDLPAINVPVVVNGAHMPCGVQLVGKPGCERQLLAAAAALELRLETG